MADVRTCGIVKVRRVTEATRDRLSKAGTRGALAGHERGTAHHIAAEDALRGSSAGGKARAKLGGMRELSAKGGAAMKARWDALPKRWTPTEIRSLQRLALGPLTLGPRTVVSERVVNAEMADEFAAHGLVNMLAHIDGDGVWQRTAYTTKAGLMLARSHR